MRLDNPSISGSITYLGGGTNIIEGIDASLTGSFTGSFDGDGTGITGIISSSHAVTASYALTASHSENLIISGNISNVDYIDFITTIEVEPQEGRVAWNLDEGTLDVGLENGSVLQVGQEQHWHVRNNTTASILNGQAVMATGALGASSRITVAPMIADGSIPAKYFLGVATQEIAADSDGYVTTFGKVRGYDTSLIPSGSILWCDPSTPGGLTTTEPSAPNLKLPVAFTLDAKSNGNIAVRANTGVRLENSHDVQIDSATDGDLLVRSGSIWYNSHSLTGSYDLTGSLIVTDEIVAQTLHVQQVTSSIVYSSGSNIFGNQLSDTHQFTGSVLITGSSTFTNHGPAYFLQGRIGIGGETITDSHLLNIQGSSATDNVGVVLNKTNSTAQVWGITNTGPLTIYNYTDSSEALRIDASNNVGIGTNSPSSFGKLTVNDNSTNSRIISRNNYNSGLHYFTAQAFATDTNGGRVSIGSNALVQTAYSDAITRLDTTRGAWSWVFQTQKSTYTSQDKASLQYMTAGGAQSERLHIDSDGNIGIGLDPAAKLDVLASGTTLFRAEISGVAQLNIGNGGNSINYYDANTQIFRAGNGDEYMRIAPDGDVGIGDNSPYFSFEVDRTGSAAFGTVKGIGRFRNSADSSKGVVLGYDTSTQTGVIYAETAAPASNLAFYTYNSSIWGERMRITGGGSIGINTTQPETLLEVQQASVGNDGVTFDADASNRATMQIQVNTNYTRIQTYGRGTSSGYLSLNPLGNNVGIGTISPTSELDIYHATDPEINLTIDTHGQAGTLKADADGLHLYGKGSSDQIRFYTSTSEAMRIDSSGRLNINYNNSTIHTYGTNAFGATVVIKANSTTPNAALALLNGNVGGDNPVWINFINEFVSNQYNYIARIGAEPTQTWTGTASTRDSDLTFHTTKDGVTSEKARITNQGGIDISDGADVHSSNDRFSLGYYSGNYGWIQTWNGTPLYLNLSGNAVYAGTQRIDNNSDQRLKENITSLTGALDIVSSLQGRKFNMIDEGGKLRYGFVAQEVQEHLPDFVEQTNRHYTKDDIKVENILTLENSGASWAAILVEAIKELKAENDALKARIEILENK